MPKRVVRVGRTVMDTADERLQTGIAAIQRELKVTPGFPADVERAAEEAAANPRLPELDRTDIPFVTLDPAGSMDLDQALHLERRPGGYVVRYAIADVAAFVSPGDAVDQEAHHRGETLYGADTKVPLHPKVLSEGAASLLPDQVRPSLLWTIELDESGERTGARVERALVRSRAQLTYADTQRRIDAADPDPVLGLLGEVGRLRLEREAARGGTSLPLPEQEVQVHEGRWSLDFRVQAPVERWNAEISLLTGMTAAAMMLDAKVGILRTLPPPDARDVARLRHTTRAVGLRWAEKTDYRDMIRAIDPTTAAGAAVLMASTRVFRGSGYVTFEGSLPDQTGHAALAASYSHTTAPLRRLVDRYAGEVCVALCAGREVPAWVTERFDALPEEMRESARRSGQYERAVLDLVESAVLSPHVGTVFDGVVVDRDEKKKREGAVVIQEPAIEGPVGSDHALPLGEPVQVELTVADPERRRIRFELLGKAPAPEGG